MKKISLALLAIFVCAAGSVRAQDSAAGIQFAKGSWQEILDLAKKENKPVFVDCFTTWCGPCKMLDKNVFPKAEVGEFMNANFIAAKIDMEKGEGIELAKKYEIRAYPTMIVVDSDGKILHRICGYRPADRFLEDVKVALDPEKRLSASIAKFEAGERSAEFMKAYLGQLASACQNADAAFAAYWSGMDEKQKVAPENWAMYMKFGKKAGSEPFNYVLANREKFGESVDEKMVNAYLEGGFTSQLKTFIYRKKIEEFEAALVVLKESGLPGAAKIEADVNVYRLQKGDDMKAYGLAAADFVEKYVDDSDARRLNSFAWSFYENIDDKDLLNKAVVWAEKGFKAGPSYAICDTWAAVLFKAGRTDEGRAKALEAIELAKKENGDSSDTQKMMDKYVN